MGSFEVLSDHGDTTEDDIVVDEFSKEFTGTMPSLPPDSWFKETRTSSHAETRCGEVSKTLQWQGPLRRRRVLSLLVGIGAMSSLTFCMQHGDLLAQNATKSVSSAKGSLSVNFPICCVCQILGVYSQHLPITALQYDIPSEGECRPDEVPIEVAPCEEWLPEEVELNTVTISNMSIDSKRVETDGKRGQLPRNHR